MVAPIGQTNSSSNDDKVNPYQGAIGSGCIYSDYAQDDNEESGDASSVNGKKSASSTKTKTSQYSSNYVDNTSDNDNSGYSSDPMYNAALWVDIFMGELLNGGLFDEENLTEGLDGDNPAVLNGKQLKKIYGSVKTACSITTMIANRFDFQNELREKFNKINPNRVQDDEEGKKKTSNSETASKQNSDMMKMWQDGFDAIIKRVETHNKAVWERKEAEIKDRNSTDDFVNWITCGKVDKEEAEDMKAMSEEFAEVRRKNAEALKEMAGDISDSVLPGGQKVGADLLEEVFNLDKNTIYTDNGYVDVSASSEWLNNCQKIVTGLTNLNRTAMSTLELQEEILGMFEEVNEGERTFSNKSKSTSELVEASSSSSLSIFGSIKNDILNINSLKNARRSYELQLEKLSKSFGCRIAAKICEIVGTVLSCIPATAAIGAGLLAAGGALEYAGSELAESVDDEYIPTVGGSDEGKKLFNAMGSMTKQSTFSRVNKAVLSGGWTEAWDPTNPNNDEKSPEQIWNDFKNSINKTSSGPVNSLEDAEASVYNQLGFDQLRMTDDGYLEVDFEKIAKLQKMLDGINQVYRQMMNQLLLQQKIINTISRVSTGISGPSLSEGLFEGALESSIAQGQTIFSTAVYSLSEFRTGFNNERQQRIAHQSSVDKFFLKLATSAASFAAQYAGPVASLGGKVLGSVGEYCIDKENPSYGKTVAETVKEAVRSAIKLSADTSEKIAQGLDQVEAEIYNDMLKDGICDIGDGKYGMNADKMISLQNRFKGVISAFKLVISSIEQAQEIRNIIAEAGGLVTISKSSSLKDVNIAFARVLKNFNNTKQILMQKVSALNRIAAANEVVSKAKVKMIVVCSTTGVALVTAAICASQGAMAAAMVVLWAANAALTLFNLIYDITYAKVKSETGFGQLEDYANSVNKTKKEINQKISEALNSDGVTKSKATGIEKAALGMDAMESALSMDGSLLEDAAYGSKGINSGELEKYNSRAEGLNRAKESLLKTMKQIFEIIESIHRVASNTRMAAPGLNSFSISNNQAKQLVELALQTQMQALQTVVNRYNQKSEAAREMIMASVQLALEVAKEAASQLEDNVVKASDRNELSKKNPDSGTPEGKRLEQYKNDLANPNSFLHGLNLSMSTLSMIVEWAAAKLIDSSREVKDNKENRIERAQLDKKAADKASQKEKGIGQQLDQLESQTTADSMLSGSSEIDLQDLDLELGRAKENLDFLINMAKTLPKEGKSASDSFKEITRAKKNIVLLQQKEDLQKDINNKRRQYETTLHAYQQLIGDAQKKMEEFKTQEQQTSQNSKVLIEMADQLISKFAEMESNIQQLENCEKQIKALREKRESSGSKEKKLDVKSLDPKAVTNEQLDQQIAKVKQLQQEFKDNPSPARLAQIKEAAEQLSAMVSSLELWPEQSEAGVSATDVEAIKENFNKRVETAIKEIAGKEVEIKDLNHQQLESLYIKIRKEVFEPTSRKLQEVKAERTALFVKSKNTTDVQGKDAVDEQLKAVSDKEGKLAQEILNCNRFMGDIAKTYEGIKDKNGNSRKFDPKAILANTPTRQARTSIAPAATPMPTRTTSAVSQSGRIQDPIYENILQAVNNIETALQKAQLDEKNLKLIHDNVELNKEEAKLIEKIIDAKEHVSSEDVKRLQGILEGIKTDIAKNQLKLKSVNSNEKAPSKSEEPAAKSNPAVKTEKTAAKIVETPKALPDTGNVKTAINQAGLLLGMSKDAEEQLKKLMGDKRISSKSKDRLQAVQTEVQELKEATVGLDKLAKGVISYEKDRNKAIANQMGALLMKKLAEQGRVLSERITAVQKTLKEISAEAAGSQKAQESRVQVQSKQISPILPNEKKEKLPAGRQKEKKGKPVSFNSPIKSLNGNHKRPTLNDEAEQARYAQRELANASNGRNYGSA